VSKLFLRLEPVSLVTMKGRFGHVEHKDDADYMKQCMMMKFIGTKQGNSWCSECTVIACLTV